MPHPPQAWVLQKGGGTLRRAEHPDVLTHRVCECGIQQQFLKAFVCKEKRQTGCPIQKKRPRRYWVLPMRPRLTRCSASRGFSTYTVRMWLLLEKSRNPDISTVFSKPAHLRDDVRLGLGESASATIRPGYPPPVNFAKKCTALQCGLGNTGFES